MAKTGKVRQKHESILKVIGDNIKHYRTKSKLSREKLSVICLMEAKSIYNYENCKTDITATSLAIVAAALNLEPYQLLIPLKTAAE